MKTRTPWWPLLRNEMLAGHFPIVPLILIWGYFLWICFITSLLLLRTLTVGCRGDIALFFSSVEDVAFPAFNVWLFVTLILTAIITVPGASRPESYEFYFTRAISRRSLFRAKTAVLYAMMLAPLILNMGFALRAPDLVLKPGTIRSLTALEKDENPGIVENLDSSRQDAERRANDYLRAFPGNHPKLVQPDVKTPLEIALPNAALVYAGWLLWGGTLGLLAMQAYCAWMARHVSRRFWPMITFVGLPLLLFSFLLIRFGGRQSSALAERSFLFFASHEAVLVLAALAAIPVVHWWAERRFVELEIS
jgi:hypothetical protein